MAKQSFQEWREEQRQLYTGGSSAGNSQSSNTGSTGGTSGKQDFQAWREEQRQKYTGGSGQNTSAASGKSNKIVNFGSENSTQNPLTFSGGIKPIDTRPSVVRWGRDPIDNAATNAYRSGMLRYGSVNDWYSGAQRESDAAASEIERLQKQLKQTKTESQYAVHKWDGGVYLGIDEDVQRDYNERLTEIRKEIGEQEKRQKEAKTDLDWAQGFYAADMYQAQEEADKAALADAKLRGLDSEGWYKEAQEARQAAWEEVQELERVKNYTDAIARTYKGDYDGAPEDVLAKKAAAESDAETAAQRLAEAEERYRKADEAAAGAKRTRYDSIRDDAADFYRSKLRGKQLYEQIKAEDAAAWEEYGSAGRTWARNILASPIDQQTEWLNTDTEYKRPQDAWTYDEKETYYYLLDKDRERADEYAQGINDRNAAKVKAEKMKAIQQKAGEGFWPGLGYSALSVGAFLGSGLDMANDIIEYGARGTITQKADMDMTDFSAAVTSGVAQALNEKGGTMELLGEQRGWGDAYQIAMSVAQSMASIAVGGEVGSLAMFFGSAGASGIDEALQRGATPGKAIAYGVTAGAAEVLTEKYSVENLLTNVNVNSALKSILMQAGIEASEESMSTLLNTVSDAIINGDQSDYRIAIASHVSAGDDYETAKKKAGKEWIDGIVWDAVSGAVSGGTSAGLKIGAQGVTQGAFIGAALDKAARRDAAKTEYKTALSAIEERLTALGEETNVPAVAQAIGRKVSGATGYSNERVFQHSKYGQQVLEELERARNGQETTEETAWAAEVYSKLDAEARRRMEAAAATEAATAKTAEAKAGEQTNAGEQTQQAAQAETPAQAKPKVQGPVMPGELRATYNGRPGTITSLIKQGDKYIATVRLGNGKKVNAREERLNFDEQTQAALDMARDYSYGDDMVLSYSAAVNGTDFRTYMTAYSLAHMYGEATNVTEQQAYTASLRDGTAAEVLTEAQFRKAFRSGRSSENSRVINTAARPKGTGKLLTGKDITYEGQQYAAATEADMSREELSVLKTMAKITGVDIVMYKSTANAAGVYSGANGFMRNGTMYLDVNAGANMTTEESAVLLTAAHELTHWMREQNEEGYRELRDFIVQHLMDEGTDLEALAKAKQKREASPEFTLADAMEEIVADSCEMMLRDTKLPEIMAKEKPGLYEQIREWLSNFAEKLRKAFTGVEARHEEARAMMQYAEEMQQIWDNALAGAVRNTEAATENGTTAPNNGTTTPNNGTATPNNGTNDGLFAETAKFSNRQREEDTIKRQIKDNLEELNDMEPVASIYDSLDMGKDKGQYRKWIVDKLASTGYQVDRKGFGKITFTPKQLNAGINYVNEPAEMAAFLTIPKVLKQGAEIREHDNHKERNVETITFSAPVEINGTRGNVAVVVKLTKNYFKALRILTPEGKVYSLSGYEKTELTPTQHTPTSGAESASISSVDNTIPQAGEESNTKYSMRERDDAADVKTAEKYFGTTYKIAEAGYLLRDGKLLDMSGRHKGAPGGYRTVDHRDITDAFDGDYGDGSYSGGINLSTKPNAKQLDVLDRYISSFRGEVTLDIDNANGDTVVSIEYPKRTYSKRIINDINEYFDNGTVPAQPSDLGQFRYSMRDIEGTETETQQQEKELSYADLRREAKMLRARAEYWKGQTRTTKEATVRKADTDKLARRLADELYNSDQKTLDEVKDSLKELGDYIVQTRGEELSYDEIYKRALEIADMLLGRSETVIDDSGAETLKELYDYLKANKLKVNEREMLDLPEGWKRQHRRIRFSEDGLPIDTAWMELQEKFGEGMFPNDITAQADKLEHIAEVEQRLKPMRANPFTRYMSEMRQNVAQEIIDTMLSDEIRQTPKTAADRANAKLEAERARYTQMRKRMEQRVRQVAEEGKAAVREAVQGERRYQLQRQERAQKVKSITKMWNGLYKKITDNNAKSHVPDALKEPIIELLQGIDPTTERQKVTAKEFAEKLGKLARALDKQRKFSQGEDGAEIGSSTYYDLPLELAEQMQAKADEISAMRNESKDGWKLADMELRDLLELENMLKTVSEAVTTANEMYTINGRVDETSRTSVKHLEAMGEKGKATGRLERFLSWDNLTPVYYFERMGEGGRKIFKSLTEGWGKLAMNAQRIKEFSEGLYNSTEVRAAEDDIITVQLHKRIFEEDMKQAEREEATVAVRITKAQIMDLYGLSMREQALNHILGAGIRIGDIARRGESALVQADNYLLTAEELEEIINKNLTARDKEIVKGMQKFMNTVGSAWGNEISQKRWGINTFTEENYWPIDADSRTRAMRGQDGGSVSLFRVVNMGFAKPIKPGSRNAINIGSAYDVFSNHMADMAKYNAMVLPVLDAMKWISYSAVTAQNAESGQYTTESVQKAMEKAYGREAVAYFTQLMRDVNGSKEGGRGRSGIEGITGRYKRAAVAANLRVAFLQPTAYARAAMVLSPKYLAAGGVRQDQLRQSYNEAMQYSGAMNWKALGFFDVNINNGLRSQIKHDESTVDKIVDWTMKPAEWGDTWTWTMLWYACKREQTAAAVNAGKTLTHEELMQRTAERFDEVVYKTQVMDSTLTRSQMMRSNDGKTRGLTAFMAEPTLSYNTVMNLVSEYMQERRTSGPQTAWAKCGPGIARGIAVYLASAAVNAIVESAADAWRDDDEYMTYWEKWLAKMFGEDSFFDGNLYGDLSILSKLPVVKDALSVLRGEDASRMETEGLASLYQFAQTTYSKIQSLAEDGEDVTKVTEYGWLMQGLRAASQLTGIPGYNMTREIAAIWNNTFGKFTGEKLKTYRAQPEREIKNAYTGGYLTEEEAKALLMDANVMGESVIRTERLATQTIDDWTDNGAKYEALLAAIENDDKDAYDAAFQALKDTGRYAYDIQTKVRNEIKQMYQGDERGRNRKLGKEETIAALSKYGRMTDHDAKVTAQQWTCLVTEGFAYDERKKLFLSGDLSHDDAVDIVRTYGKDDDGKLLVEYKDKAKAKEYAEKEVQKWQMAKDTGIDYDRMKDAFYADEITSEQMYRYYQTYGGLSEEDAGKKVYLYEYKKGDAEETGTTWRQAQDYDKYIAASGADISKEQYDNYLDGHGPGTFHGDLKPGTTNSYITNSKRNKAWAYIDSLPLTATEKDALAQCYAELVSDTQGTPRASWMEVEQAPWNSRR